MAKATKLYAGHTSYGTPVEVAERTDGVWFIREYGYNGYGKSWNKWREMAEDPQHPTKLTSKVECATEIPDYTLSEEERVKYLEFGFNLLHLIDTEPNVRLPNP